jgi:hypothetical protein
MTPHEWGKETIESLRGQLDIGDRDDRVLQAPEIVAGVGEVGVRFRPTQYVAPERIAHDLSALQRPLLQMLAKDGSCSLAEIMASLPRGTSKRTVQDNLQLLLQLDLVDRRGERRWARWVLKGAAE